MSGYLEVKYPFKASYGLNPFKSWKRQWCILRPSSTYEGGGSLAVYCSEAGAPAGTVELRSGCLVKRAKSRSRPNAFAVFFIEEPNKPRILLAAQTLHEAHMWMDKIRNLLNGEKLLGTESLLKDSYTVKVMQTELSRKWELSSNCNLILSSSGMTITKVRDSIRVIPWQHIKDILHMKDEDRNRNCVITIDSELSNGGEIRLLTPLANELVRAVKQAIKVSCSVKKLSRSDGDLSMKSDGDVRRTSWYSGPPSEVSLDDTDLVISKCGEVPTTLCVLDSVSRRSQVSLSSGVYEEIAEEVTSGGGAAAGVWEVTGGGGAAVGVWEPAYEPVGESVYATMRRARRPPPLPPRTHAGTLKLGRAWSPEALPSESGVTRHSSLGSLAKPPRRQPFSVFRKRLKSDSRIVTSPKSETSKEKDVETKKKRFEFTPTRDIFKSFKVSRKLKNLKITNGNLTKGETKSCEFLDETQPVATNRCSKSVECLEGDAYEEFGTDLSLDLDTDLSALALPDEIVSLFLRGPELKVRLKEAESEYMPMSPIVPPAPVDHYIVMSPKTNLA